MKYKILLFGSLVDVFGSQSYAMDVCDDTDALKQALLQQFPLLNQHRFNIAIDKKIISENTPISSTSEIALLPPFSGG